MNKARALFAAAVVSIAATVNAPLASARPRFDGPDPYPVPQSAPGLPDRAAVDITASGYPAFAFVYAQLCDGVSPETPAWSPASDCGPATAGVRATPAGTVAFPGTSTSYALLIWHGDNGNDKINGEQTFNCLAPDDDPRGTVTAEGNQPIDQGLPAWGSKRGGDRSNPAQYNASAPCQIRLTTSLPAYSPSDIFLPIDLAPSSHAPPSGSTGLHTGSASAKPSSMGPTRVVGYGLLAVLAVGLSGFFLRRRGQRPGTRMPSEEIR